MKTTFALAILATVVSAHNFIFSNDCPDELALYNGGEISAISTISPGGVDRQGNFGQAYWTNLNGGKPNGDNALKFLPGAEDNGSSSYYFIKPSNKRLGVGISVQPVTETCPKDGECKKITCDTNDCDTAFDKQEDASAKAPALPLYKCSGDDLTYLVTFCPGGKYVTELESHEIHPNGDEKKCLDVDGDEVKDGAKLTVNDCDGSDTQKWNIDSGVTHVRVAGSYQCIERADSENGVVLKTCGSNWAPQRWDFNDVGRIGSGGICLDVADGVKAEDCKSQEEAQSQIFSI